MTTDQLLADQEEVLDNIEVRLDEIGANIRQILDFLIPPYARGMDQDLMPRVNGRMAPSFVTVNNPDDEKMPAPLPLRRTDGTEVYNGMPNGPPALATMDSFIWPPPRQFNGSWAQALNLSSERSPSVQPEESKDPEHTGPPPGGA
jgi:hypothetical protein